MRNSALDFQGNSDTDIKRSGSRPSTAGSPDYFVGSVQIDPVIEAPAPARVRAALVSFAPRARTAWHTHPLGQTLLVTAGQGLAQVWGQQVQQIFEGDVVWFAPSEKHWHGASLTSAMSHLAFQEALDGSAVHWLEQVSESDYRQ